MFLGIDISKDNFDAVLLDPTTKKPRHKPFPNTPTGFERLQEWLGTHHPHVCLEATGTYGEALARFLHENGYRVSVVNPARIKAFGQTQLSRTKTDKDDATLIARFCQMHQPEDWTPPPPQQSELQALVRRLESLIEMRQMERNRLAAGLVASIQASLQEHIAYLDKEIEKTEQRIRDLIDQDTDLKQKRDLITSIPGIGQTTAAALLAELGDISQFTGARQVAAFAGLAPRLRQSGKFKGHTRLSKVGTGRLRRTLFLPTLSALRFNPLLRDLKARLLANGKSKMLIVGAAMRKLLCLVFGVLKSGKPFDPDYAPKLRAKA